MTPHESRRLETAFELVLKRIIGRDPFRRFQNGQRSKDDPPASWTQGFGALFAGSVIGSAIGGSAPYTPPPPPKLPPPPKPPPGPTLNLTSPPNQPPTIRGLAGQAGPVAKNVPAFDRPIPVIVMGPKPIPVTMAGPWGTGTSRGPQPPTPPRRPKEEGSSIADAIFKRFAFILGPLTALSTVLGSVNSGFGVFQRSVGALGASLAPLLLPPFMVLSALVLVASDKIANNLIPALDKWYQWFLKHRNDVGATAAGVGGVAAIPWLAKGLSSATTGIGGKVGSIGKAAGRMSGPFAALASVYEGLTGGYYTQKRAEGHSKGVSLLAGLGGGATDILTTPLSWLGYESFGQHYRRKHEFARRAYEGEDVDTAGGGGAPPEESEGIDFEEAMTLVSRSLQMSMGPQATYQGLADVGKQAQLAALNQDPIEAMTRRIIKDTIEIYLKVIAHNTGREEPSRPTFQAGQR